MVKDGRLVLAELKTERGKVSGAQQRWLADLGRVASASNGALEVHTWRPSQMADIDTTLA